MFGAIYVCMYVYTYICIYLTDLLKQYCPGWFQTHGFNDPLAPASPGVALWATVLSLKC